MRELIAALPCIMLCTVLMALTALPTAPQPARPSAVVVITATTRIVLCPNAAARSPLTDSACHLGAPSRLVAMAQG